MCKLKCLKHMFSYHFQNHVFNNLNITMSNIKTTQINKTKSKYIKITNVYSYNYLFIKDIKLLDSIYIKIQFNEIVKQTRNDIHLCWVINNMNRRIILQNVSCKIIMS